MESPKAPETPKCSSIAPNIATPELTSSKRALSSSSTPSPSTLASQVKKARTPELDTVPVLDTASIVQKVMAEINEQIKATIAENVNYSVTAMAKSVAEIISQPLNERISSVEAENNRLNLQVEMLCERVKALESGKKLTDQSIDTAEQYSRRTCLRISGIAETQDESTDAIVLGLASACKVPLSLSDIDRSHRIRPMKPREGTKAKARPADIIVKFVSYRCRSTFFRGKSNLKDSDKFKRCFINEDLTRQRADLLYTARMLVRAEKLLSAWSYDGRIYIKDHDGSRHLITSKEELPNPLL